MPFKISENISKASISPGFQGQQSGDQLSPREFRVSRGGGGAKETCHEENFVTVSLFSLLKS